MMNHVALVSSLQCNFLILDACKCELDGNCLDHS